jgi:hypothetical protein
MRGPCDRDVQAYLHSRIPGFIFMRIGTQRRCAMWRMSNAQTLVFVAAVTVAFALLLA